MLQVAVECDRNHMLFNFIDYRDGNKQGKVIEYSPVSGNTSLSKQNT